MSLSFLLTTMIGAAPLVESPTKPWPSLRGRWAFIQVTAAVSDAPLIGKVTSETRAVGVLDLHQVGARLRLVEHICDLKTSSPTPLVSTKYPKAFVTALSGKKRWAQLVRDRDGGIRFRQPKMWSTQGLRLSNVVREKLPDDAQDPRVYDADGDGEPGLTVRVGGMVSGDVRVVSRGWTALNGRLDGAAQIEGRIRWQTEQRVVGATNGLLGNPPTTVQHPDPARSWFRMVRVSKKTTCENVGEKTGVLLDAPTG